MLCVVSEDTERIIEERRLSCLSGLAADISATNTRAGVLAAMTRQLGGATKDLPFTLTYLFDAEGKANLACVTGVDLPNPIAPATIDPACAAPEWPVDQLLADRTILTVGDLGQRFDQVPTGGWDKPPVEAVVAPIARQGEDVLAGFLVAAINPYRPLVETNLRFINLVSGQLASGLANADAYEEARRRVEALAEIDRAKTTFFSNVSHEFRTPLTLMIGPLDELISTPVCENAETERALIATAHRNALRLLKLVNSLLDFSRIEAGRLGASYEPVDLAALTADIASGFRSAVDKAGLSLIVDCSPLPEPVYVDRDLWEKIVLNLLSNAFKFTFSGEIEVAVRATEARNAAELRVRDTGTGIPAHELPRLFDRFHRVEGAIGRTFEGSGIGLALVQELAKLHGGTVTVDSELGSGSVFVVTVPFGVAHLPSDRIGRVAVPAPSGIRVQAYVEEALRWLPDREDVNPGIAGPGSADMPSLSTADDLDSRRSAPVGVTHARVLLADDNADMRDYLRRLLVGQGYSVEAVMDGEAALAAARRQLPDLVLSDIMMPRLDGFELLRALRADQTLRNVPVVLLSARAGEEASEQGLASGADDYLTKPFSARELFARVSANLKMAQMRRQTAEALHTHTAELEAVLATVSAGVWFTKDPDARRIWGNRQASAWLRLPQHANLSLLGSAEERPKIRVFRDGREAAPEALGIRRALRGEEVRDDEVEVRFDDGTSLTLLTQASPLRDHAGAIVGAVSAGIYNSGRKRLQERFRQVVEAAPSALLVTGPDGRIAMVNAQSEKLFGYPRNELLGERVEILVPDRFRRRHPAMRLAFFASP
jgi:signal transduction histidine kinase/FixJ family two-component response regulator